MTTRSIDPAGFAAAHAVPDVTACTHCGLPVPPALVEVGAPHQFCCHGCRTVYAVISEHGLSRYYAVRRDADADARPARTTGRTYADFDDPAFAGLYCRALPDGAQSTELYLEGVHCAACVWLVERAPRLVDGAAEVRLDVGRSRARVVWDPKTTSLSAIARVLDSLGYPAHPFRGIKAQAQARAQDRALLVRIGITGAVAGNAMAIAFALYGGILHGMEPEFAAFFRWASLVITIPALVWGGSVFFRGAWAAARTRTLHMDVPISLGIAIAFLSGAVNTVRGTGPVYFESVTALIFLLLCGRYLQGRQQRTAADAAELLHSLAPASARLLEDGQVREVPLEALLPGALIEVRAGETIAADGTIERGHSAIDTSVLTGESRPVDAEPGAHVHAGTTNLAARLEVRVESAGENTRVGRLVRLVEEHARRRAPIVQLADRLSGWFVLAVIALAAITAVLWLVIDPARAVDNVVALLIVTCPCALGLATPLAVSAAIGQAARSGLLVKGADVLERADAPRRGRLWLDKTGTLTSGRTTLVTWSGDAAGLALAAALEAHSSHPIAQAFVAAAPVGGRALEVDAVETQGAGVEGSVGGRRVAVGSPSFVAARADVTDAATAAAIECVLAAAHTPVVVAIDGRVAGVAGFGDPPRPEAKAAIDALRRRGWRIGILSGDHPRVVEAVAKGLGVAAADCIGGASPEQKLATVVQGLADGPVVMVGDGVNDAAALGAATVGIGVHGGAEASLAAADVFSSRPGLDPVVRFFDGADRTMRVIRRNLVFSLAYNVAGVALAMAGWIDPLLAAVLMPASSLTVIVSSYRARMFDAGREDRP